MYNFRYHLVTICSIFIALALGLLLGAAIAASELAQSTSEGMVESVLSRYETLVDENAEMEKELQDNSSLAGALTTSWGEERLDGRTIVLLLGNTLEDRNLQSSITHTLSSAGASVVNVMVQRKDFGLEDERISAALREIVEEVSGESYQQTLAKQLMNEWRYVYTTSSVGPTEEDFDLVEHVYIQPVEEPLPENALTADEETPPSAAVSVSLEPQTSFQRALYDGYPLTHALLTFGVIDISVDYTPLLGHVNPSPPKDQQAALGVVTAWGLPYGVNGLINGLAQQQDDAMMQTQVGLQLTRSFQEEGTQSNLAYPAWLRSSLPKVTSGNVPKPNYYTLLIQPEHLKNSMDILASENNLSCVTTPDSIPGQYSIVALLSGSQAGIYGADRAPEHRFAPLPEDPSGRAAFR